jgi:hypothetical protein
MRYLEEFLEGEQEGEEVFPFVSVRIFTELEGEMAEFCVEFLDILFNHLQFVLRLFVE